MTRPDSTEPALWFTNYQKLVHLTKSDIPIYKSRHKKTVKSSEYSCNRRTAYKVAVCCERRQCVMSYRPSAELPVSVNSFLIKRSTNIPKIKMSLTLLLPSGMKRTTFRDMWMTIGAADGAASGTTKSNFRFWCHRVQCSCLVAPVDFRFTPNGCLGYFCVAYDLWSNEKYHQFRRYIIVVWARVLCTCFHVIPASVIISTAVHC